MEIWKVSNWNVEIKIGIKPEVPKLSSVNVQTNLLLVELPKLFPNFLMMMRRLLKMLKSFYWFIAEQWDPLFLSVVVVFQHKFQQ